jgi:hypothetical protein
VRTSLNQSLNLKLFLKERLGCTEIKADVDPVAHSDSLFLSNLLLCIIAYDYCCLLISNVDFVFAAKIYVCNDICRPFL